MPSASAVADGEVSVAASIMRPCPYAPLWVSLITVGAGVLRTLYLTSQGITLDESFSIFLGRTTWGNFVHIVWGSEFNMALYYILLRLWMHLGHSEFLIRMLGVLFATGTVPIVYLLGKRLFDDRTAIVAALLLAVHPSHLMLAQRARSYPLVILLVSLASLCFVCGLQKPTWTMWMAYAGLSAAAVYSHFFAVLVIAAQLLSLLFLLHRTLRWEMVFSSLALLALLLVPLAAFVLLHGDKSHVAWVPDASIQQVLYVLYSLSLSKARCLVYVLAWCIAAWAAFRETSLNRRWSYQFSLAWLIVPLALVIAASLVQPLLIERFLSICIPPAVLLAAAGIVQFSRWSRTATIGLLALTLLYSASGIRFYDRHPEFAEDMRGACAYLLAHVRPGDAVIAASLTGLTFDYYREIDKTNLPPFTRLDSAASPLPSLLPQNVWLLGGTNFNRNWKGAVPNAEAEVQGFSETHKREYCPLPTYAAGGGVKVWRFGLCSSHSESAR